MVKRYLLNGFLLVMLCGPAANAGGGVFTRCPLPKDKEDKLISYLTDYMQFTYKRGLFESFLFISYKQQKMYHIINGHVVRIYYISASKYGLGNKNGSGCTPLGMHEIVDKFGYGVPVGGLIRGRAYTGKVVKLYDNNTEVPDCVLTRILWLKGEERCVNKGVMGDSYNRSIYIHGTPEEGKIGRPASKGCIRMCNVDVAELFDFAYLGMKVLILKE